MSLIKGVLAVVAVFVLGTACQAADWAFATQNLPPFSYEENGKASGPLVDIVRAVCAALDQTCSIAVLPLRRGEHGLDDGEYDGMFPLVSTRQRQESYFMVQPMVATSCSFIARTDSRWTYNGVGSLDGRTIGVFGPSGTFSNLEELIQKDTTARLEVEISNDVVLRKLAAGRYGQDGGAFANRDVALALIAKLGITGLRLAGDGPMMLYTIALSKKNIPDAMAKRFDDTVTRLKASGEFKAILARYNLQDRETP